MSVTAAFSLIWKYSSIIQTSGCQRSRVNQRVGSGTESRWIWSGLGQKEQTCRLDSCVKSAFLQRRIITEPVLYQHALCSNDIWPLGSGSWTNYNFVWISDDERENPWMHIMTKRTCRTSIARVAWIARDGLKFITKQTTHKLTTNQRASFPVKL